MSSLSGPSDDEPDSANGAAPRLESLPRGVEYFTMQEAARIKGVSYHTVSRATRTGRLASRRTGRLVLIARDDLAAWQPMRERAPRRYRQRLPDPGVTPSVIDLASGERLELARRVSALYAAIQTSALIDPIATFARTIAERFALAMEFERVALWVITADRTEIILLATVGRWFAPGEEPAELIRLPYDPERMYIVPSNVYDGIACWLGKPRPVRLNRAFATVLTANDQLLGYIIGDRDGTPFSLTDNQIALGHDLASLIGITIELRRSRELESIARRQAVAESNDHAAALSRLTHAINTSADLAGILRQAGRDAITLTGAHYGGVVLQSGSEAIVGYWTADGVDLPEEREPLNLGILAGTMRAFQAGRPLLIAWSDATDIERMYWQRSGSRSCLTLPFNVDGELAGVMMIKFRDDDPRLTPEQIEVCETLAAGCVTAIVKQRLLDALATERARFRQRRDGLSAAGG